MNFQQLSKRALEIRRQYETYEIKIKGRSWTNEEIMMGLVGDIGDLTKLIMTKEGARTIDNVDQKLKEELSDCLYCLLVLSQKYNINLEDTFIKSMDKLAERIKTGDSK